MKFVTTFKQALVAIFCVFAFTALPANAYNKIIVFGDSLSDNGNLYEVTRQLHEYFEEIEVIPATPPYYQGRFTNGLVWAEVLAEKMGVKELKNYAYGGAWAEPYEDSRRPDEPGQPERTVPYGLDVQVQIYFDDMNTKLDNEKNQNLYVIWAGNNDYLQGVNRDVEYATTNTVSAISQQLDILYSSGARQFLLLNLPDLTLTPVAAEYTKEQITKMQQMVLLHNQKLAASIEGFAQSHADAQVKLMDVSTHFSNMISHPEQYGLRETQKSCIYKYANSDLQHQQLTVANEKHLAAAKKANLEIVHNPLLRMAYLNSTTRIHDDAYFICKNPKKYVFWDYVHPTREVHAIIADLVLELYADSKAVYK